MNCNSNDSGESRSGGKDTTTFITFQASLYHQLGKASSKSDAALRFKISTLLSGMYNGGSSDVHGQFIQDYP